MSADRSSGERIRRLKALAAANGPATRIRDYDTWQTVQFGKTPYLRLSATGVVVEEKCCLGSGSDPDPYCAWKPANARNFLPIFGGVAYGNNRWVAVGIGGVFTSKTPIPNGKNIQYSNDGINWQESSGTPFGKAFISYSFGCLGIAYGNNQWVAVGQGADNAGNFNGKNILYSSDGINWQESTGTPFGIGGLCFGIAYGNNQWVAVGGGVDNTGNPNGKNILYSSDGINWQEASGTPFGIGSNSFNSTGVGIAYGNNQWIAVGKGAGKKNILYSSDGKNWQESSWTQIGTKYCVDVAYGNNLWVAVNGEVGNSGVPDSGPNIIYSTDNGLTWLESPGKNFNRTIASVASGIAYGNNRWVVTGFGYNSPTLIDPTTILYTSDPTAAC